MFAVILYHGRELKLNLKKRHVWIECTAFLRDSPFQGISLRWRSHRQRSWRLNTSTSKTSSISSNRKPRREAKFANKEYAMCRTHNRRTYVRCVVVHYNWLIYYNALLINNVLSPNQFVPYMSCGSGSYNGADVMYTMTSTTQTSLPWRPSGIVLHFPCNGASEELEYCCDGVLWESSILRENYRYKESVFGAGARPSSCWRSRWILDLMSTWAT